MSVASKSSFSLWKGGGWPFFFRYQININKQYSIVLNVRPGGFSKGIGNIRIEDEKFIWIFFHSFESFHLLQYSMVIFTHMYMYERIEIRLSS